MMSEALTRSRRLSVILGIVLCTIFLCSACQSETGAVVITEDKATTHLERSELEDWVSKEVDAVLNETGLMTEWQSLVEGERPRWRESKAEILARSLMHKCAADPQNPNPASVGVQLVTDRLDQDPFVFLGRIQKMWEERGWSVSGMFEAGGKHRLNKIVARRGDSALLTLGAGDYAGGNILILMVVSPCSDHPSVLR